MAQKVLITGGLGFIGRALARTLVRQGMTVRLMDNLSPPIHGVDSQPELGALLEKHDVEVMRGDVCDRRDWVLALRDVASVVHLAAETGTGQSMYRIGDYTSTNVLGTALLLDVLANDDVRSPVRLTPRDVVALESVREMLNDHFMNPPTIAQIARQTRSCAPSISVIESASGWEMP